MLNNEKLKTSKNAKSPIVKIAKAKSPIVKIVNAKSPITKL